jgi:hypothetical protein
MPNVCTGDSWEAVYVVYRTEAQTFHGQEYTEVC